MDDALYESCLRYFTSLANFGYRSEEDVKKLLFYVFIQELVNTTSIVIPKEDYKHLEGALYSLYGTTCLMPYPDYCENPMTAHLGDIIELSYRVERLEEDVDNINNTIVVKPETDQTIEVVDDIVL